MPGAIDLGPQQTTHSVVEGTELFFSRDPACAVAFPS